MHPFDQDISLTPIFSNLDSPNPASSDSELPSQFKSVVSDNWSVNGIPDGGYLMAMITRAMWHRCRKKSTPILTANFISRSAPGNATIQVEPIIQSAGFDRLEGRLSQGGQEKVRMFGTFAGEKTDCTADRIEKSPPAMAPFEECIRIPKMPNYSIFHNMDTRLDPTCAGWMLGQNLSKTSEIKGWIQFEAARPLDVFSIVLMADAFPPAVLPSHGMVAWVPTLEFSVNIRNIPDTSRIKCIFRTHFISCGLLEEDGELWDESGRIIAVSRQFARFRKNAPEISGDTKTTP
ncbi:MAG: thioesterase family protein [Deltaproteobacteria bacterium]|nr:MAG: thioesterase family protein [Deltaproteobacteria bacterium]